MSAEDRAKSETSADAIMRHCEGYGVPARDYILNVLVAYASEVRREARREAIAECATATDRHYVSFTEYNEGYNDACNAIRNAIEQLKPPIQAHSKTEYKRLATQGANVLPPARGIGDPRPTYGLRKACPVCCQYPCYCAQSAVDAAAGVEADTVSVPMEPTEAMLVAAADWSREKYGMPVGNDGAIGCYKAMLNAAKAQT